VEVDRNPQGGRAVEDGVEVRVVEVDAPAVAVDHRADEAVADGALEFVGCGAGFGYRQRREAGQSPGIALHGRGEFVIAANGQPYRRWTVGLLHARGHQRQHGQVDAGAVHLLDAGVPEVGQRLADVWPGFQPATRTIEEILCGVMLFECDGAHQSSSTRVAAAQRGGCWPARRTVLV
jgi:hypothetical protein